jgi:hypothetical protein
MAAINPNSPALAAWAARWQAEDYRRAGRISQRWQAEIARDPYLRDAVMVIELVLGGPQTRTIRAATVPVRSVSEDGTVHDALPLLMDEPELRQAYSLGSGTSEGRSLQVSLCMLRVDVMAILRSGGILAGICEISLESASQINDYAQRYVLLRGDVSGASFGASRAPSLPGGPQNTNAEIVTFSISDPRDTAGTLIPPFVIDATRWLNVHESSNGERYPVIVNRALRCPARRVTSATTGANSFVAALRHGLTIDPTGSASVFVNGVGVAQADATYGWTVQEPVDDQGTSVTAIRFTNPATTWEDTDAVHVTVEQFAEPERRYSPVGVVRYIVSEFSPIGVQGLNPELFATAEGRWAVGSGWPRCIVNSTTGGGSVLDWIETGFLASFPMISMAWEAGGYGPILTDRRLPPVADWTAGAAPLMGRASAVQETAKNEIYNEFQIRYGYDPLNDVYRQTMQRGALTSGVCQQSRLMVGQRDAPVLESLYVEDDTTAAYVLDWLVDHLALPSYLVEYEAMPWIALRYRRGDPVLLTDSDLGWQREQATIEALTYRRGRSVVVLRVWLRYLDLGGQGLSRPVTL